MRQDIRQCSCERWNRLLALCRIVRFSALLKCVTQVNALAGTEQTQLKPRKNAPGVLKMRF
jgi:hypothetical protein